MIKNYKTNRKSAYSNQGSTQSSFFAGKKFGSRSSFKRSDSLRGSSYKSSYSGYRQYSRKRFNPYRDSSMKHEMYISKASTNQQISIHDQTITFSDFDLNHKLLNNIKNLGYTHPTYIQSQVIQNILDKKDVLGLASTGSGKTAAFLIPLINNALNNTKSKCLVVTPTRELALQIKQEFMKLAKETILIKVLLEGGASAWDQIRLLNKNPKFVFATPGRLLDLYSRKKIELSCFDNVVLDEVDQMLDMGFLNDIKTIIQVLKKPRQSLFFSATLKPKLEEVAMTLLESPIKVEIAKSETAKNVDQDIVKIGSKTKIQILHDILINSNYDKVLVFVKTKQGADALVKELKEIGHQAESLHSNKTLGVRNKTLAMFKGDALDILIATDIVARGIDVKNISHVINYDLPNNIDDYIHRIGRTGRAGKPGKAITFVK